MKKTLKETLIAMHKWDKETFVAKEDLLQDNKVKDSKIPSNVVRKTDILDSNSKINLDLIPNIPTDKVDGVSGNAQTIDYNGQRLTFAQAFNQLISDNNVSLLSNADKAKFDTLIASFESETNNNVVDTIKEILNLFSTYDGAVDIATALGSKLNETTFNSYKVEVEEALGNKQDNITPTNPINWNCISGKPTIPSVSTTVDSANSTNAVSGSAVAKYVSDNSGMQELTTQYVRIWNLNAGVYKWTYSGAKYMYYSGATSNNVISIPSSTGGEVILTVNKYSNSYKNWHIITGTTVHPTLYYGYTSSTSGTYNFKAVNSLITTKPRIKSVNARRTTATTTSFSSGLNVYFYNSDYQISDGDIITITVFSAPYASISTNTQAKHFTSLTFIKQDSSHGRLDLSCLMAETTVGNVSHTPSIDGATSIDCSYNEDEDDSDYSYWTFTAYGKNANCTPYYMEVSVWNSVDLNIE